MAFCGDWSADVSSVHDVTPYQRALAFGEICHPGVVPYRPRTYTVGVCYVTIPKRVFLISFIRFMVQRHVRPTGMAFLGAWCGYYKTRPLILPVEHPG
jgi:hypothetical protein